MTAYKRVSWVAESQLEKKMTLFKSILGQQQSEGKDWNKTDINDNWKEGSRKKSIQT